MEIEKITSDRYAVHVEMKDKKGRPIGVWLSFPADDIAVVDFEWVNVKVETAFANKLDLQLKREFE